MGVDDDIPAVAVLAVNAIGGNAACSMPFEFNKTFDPNQVRRPAVVEVSWLDVNRSYGSIPMLDFERYEHAFGCVSVCSIARC